jgi:hypothetical protein
MAGINFLITRYTAKIYSSIKRRLGGPLACFIFTRSTDNFI